jgi:tRNA G18 (ribose-2'-O)-methylase SpoU
VIREVTTLDLPELEPYRTLRRPEEHKKQRIFVAEGSKVVQRLLASQLQVISILMTPEWNAQLSSEKQLSEVPIFLASRNLMESIVGFPLHQGIMAVARVPAERDLSEACVNFARPVMFVALDGIVSAENVGVIVRNAAAFGATGIIVADNSSSPYLRRAVRNSMGAIFQLPVFTTSDLVEAFALLRARVSAKIIGAHPAGNVGIRTADFTGDICIVFGNEGDGLSQTVLRSADILVSIPMLKDTDSLNVSTASAVFLYEARRSR